MTNENHAHAPQFVWDKHKERRRKRRFPIQQEVRYRLTHSQPSEGDLGTTINISSSGVLMAAHAVLQSRMAIELSIDWPALLNEVCPMVLLVFGTVVRSTEQGTAVTIERYEFRTRPRGITATHLGRGLSGPALAPSGSA